MTIREWLRQASSEFADAMIPSAGLDAEVILAHTLRKNRTWLHAHADDDIDPRLVDIANARAELRLERVPVAYIIGHKEFYGRRFHVTPDTLIPRPESEALIELVRHQLTRYPDARQLVDVGTGSGCLGVTAKLLWPQLHVTLIDNNKKTLQIAAKNADLYNVEARTLLSDLLARYPLKADIIVGNLPYVDPAWSNSPELAYEPETALYADDHGLRLIRRLIDDSRSVLTARGALIIEADTRQHDTIVEYAILRGYHHEATQGLGLVFVPSPT